jgi:hypothetical protein
MTSIAGHIRIFDHEPTDDLVLKRTAAINELSRHYREEKPVTAILKTANEIASAAQLHGSFSTQHAAMVETAIRKSSEAFIADGHDLEMLVCCMLGALQSLQGNGSSSGQITTTDIFSLGLWSALSFQLSTLLTDGHKSFPGLKGYRHDPRVVGKMAAHIVLPWIHRAFSLMKRWSLGTYHGLRRKHVDTYLNEFVFRYNRRFYRHVSFETLLGLAADKKPASYWDLIKR